MLLQAWGEQVLRVKGLLELDDSTLVSINGVQHTVHEPEHRRADLIPDERHDTSLDEQRAPTPAPSRRTWRTRRARLQGAGRHRPARRPRRTGARFCQTATTASRLTTM
jgi:G3E family GTPase